MNFLKNRLALLVLLGAVLNEYFHLIFKGVIHSYYIRNGIKTVIYLDDMMYYFISQSFTLFLVIIAYTKIGIDSATKSIMIGVCMWLCIEWIEITLQLLKINDSRLYINDGSIIQLFTCLLISLFVLFGRKN
jgi:hypothetical protein